MAGSRAVEGRRRPRSFVPGRENRQLGGQRLPVIESQPIAAGGTACGGGARADMPDRRAGSVFGDMGAQLLFDIAPEFAALRVEIAVRAKGFGIARRAALFGIPMRQVVRRVRIDEMNLQRCIEAVVRVFGVVGDAAAGPFARLDEVDVKRPSGHARQVDREDGAGEAAADDRDIGRHRLTSPNSARSLPGLTCAWRPPRA